MSQVNTGCLKASGHVIRRKVDLCPEMLIEEKILLHVVGHRLANENQGRLQSQPPGMDSGGQSVVSADSPVSDDPFTASTPGLSQYEFQFAYFVAAIEV